MVSVQTIRNVRIVHYYMSSRCRKCNNQLPKDRIGSDQYCKNCLHTETQIRINRIVSERMRTVREAGKNDDRRTDIK